MNTHLIFALFLAPQLDPYFGHIYQGLRTLARCLRQEQIRTEVQRRCNFVQRRSSEGPCRKLRLLVKGIFGQKVLELLHTEGLDTEKWAHGIRDIWRRELVARAAKNRPQHYNDIQSPDFHSTLAMYKKWDQLALQTGEENVIMQMGILRRLLVGG